MRIGFRSRRRGVLDKILGPKRAQVARMLASPRLAPARQPGGGVREALRRPSGQALRILGELAPRPASDGGLGSAARALEYARAGAAMIAVVTDAPFSGGSFASLAAARDALDEAFGAARPRLLCEDYVLDPVQLERAQDAGADAVLLVARIVSPGVLARLVEEAWARGLEPLVEVTTEDELCEALAAGATVICVSARDPNTLRVDVERAESVLRRIDRSRIAVHTTGLATPEEVACVAATRVDAALMRPSSAREDAAEPHLRAMIDVAQSSR